MDLNYSPLNHKVGFFIMLKRGSIKTDNFVAKRHFIELLLINDYIIVKWQSHQVQCNKTCSLCDQSSTLKINYYKLKVFFVPHFQSHRQIICPVCLLKMLLQLPVTVFLLAIPVFISSLYCLMSESLHSHILKKL